MDQTDNLLSQDGTYGQILRLESLFPHPRNCEVVMSCQQCGSNSAVRVFRSEVGIHSPGRDGLIRPLVLVFPEMNVCLECGFTEFVIPQRELRQLSTGAAA